MNIRDKVIKQFEDLVSQKIKEAHDTNVPIDYAELDRIHKAKEQYMMWMPNEVADLMEEVKFQREKGNSDKMVFTNPEPGHLGTMGFGSDEHGSAAQKAHIYHKKQAEFNAEELKKFEAMFKEASSSPSITSQPPAVLSKEIKEKHDMLEQLPTPKAVVTDGAKAEKLLKRFSKAVKVEPYLHLDPENPKVNLYRKIRGPAEEAEDGKSDVDGDLNSIRDRLNTTIDELGLTDDCKVKGWEDKVLEEKSAKNAADMLKESAALYEQRNALYGNSYKKIGDVMKLLFPNGVQLNSPKDFNRFTVFSTILSKILRYSNDFSNPHDDSVLDNITYFAMLRELDLNE